MPSGLWIQLSHYRKYKEQVKYAKVIQLAKMCLCEITSETPGSFIKHKKRELEGETKRDKALRGDITTSHNVKTLLES